MMKIPATRIYFSEKERNEILADINKILRSGRLTIGEHVKIFEKSLAEYVGTRYAVAVNSGTGALEIILRCMDIKGHVIVPTNTFAATAFSVIHAGLKPVFIDSDETLCLGLGALEKYLTNNHACAVIMVHVGGIVHPKIAQIQSICKKNNVTLIEDSTHALGSSFAGKKAGTFGEAAAFSFYATKVVTCGEGGAIVTNNEEVYKKALKLRDQGKEKFEENIHVMEGYNWRMAEINAAIVLHQLKRIDYFIKKRTKIAKIYSEGLKTIGYIRDLDLPQDVKPNYYKYIALLDKNIDKRKLKSGLKERYGITLSGEVYEIPCHLQPVFKHLGYKEGDFPVAEDLCNRHLCLPIFPSMSAKNARYVLHALKELLDEE